MPSRWQRGVEVVVDCGPMVHGGLCLSRLEDKSPLFIAGAIPGERVVARLDYRRRKAWFATAIEAQQPSPHRVEAPCPYYGVCGGCQMQHVGYERQLQLKEEIVRDALRRAKVAMPEKIEIAPASQPWQYRWRGDFHVIPGKDGIRDAELGFNQARSWRPIAIDDCLIHHPQIRQNLPALRQAVRRGGSEKLSALHLTVGEDGNELLLRPKPKSGLSIEAIAQVATGAEAATGDANNANPARLNLARSQGNWSTDATTLHWRTSNFRVTPETFIQVNWQQIEALYGAVLRGIGDLAGKKIVDAYAGIGVLAVEMAKAGASATCIESNPHAVQMGRLNARLNGVEDGVVYVAAAVEEALAHLAGTDCIVLDPPRAGCASPVMAWLALCGPAQVIYVSCEPATLARDLHLLVTSGPYRMAAYTLVDMFPQTYHVESVVVLERARV